MGRQMDEDQSPSGFGLFAVSCRFVLVDSRLSSPSKAPGGGGYHYYLRKQQRIRIGTEWRASAVS